jgi:hypothetical protein
MDVLDRLMREDLPGAMKRQTRLDPKMRSAEERWRYDPTILNLAGYHRKLERLRIIGCIKFQRRVEN